MKEWWENLWVYGMGFNMLLLMAVGIFKPDTRFVDADIDSLLAMSNILFAV